MAVTKTISAVGSHGWHTFTMTVTETAVNTSANTSTVNVKFTIKPKVSGYDWEGYTNQPPHGKVYFAGNEWSWSLSSYGGTKEVTLVNKTITVEHDANGAKTITGTSTNDQFRFTASSISDYYLPGNASAHGSITLTKITRTPSVTVSNTSKTETGITMKWTSDVTCNRVRYRISTNGGSSWGSWTSKTVNAKTGSYTLSSLNPNTTYTIQTELRASASGLTASANKAVKTYNWPYATVEDFTVLNEMAWVTVTNPLNRSGKLEILAQGVVIFEEEGVLSSGGYSGLDEEFLTQIPNSMTGQWAVRITYGEHVSTSATATYSAAGYNPTITSADYADTNTTAQAIIQNDKTILQNVSTPCITVAGTGQYDATIASASVTILGVAVTGSATQVQFGTINSASNVTATVTITDSRGNTASTNITITMLAYTSPSAIITIQRENNFYSETDLTVDADVMHTGSNVPTITARYREHPSGAWQNWPQITDNVTSTEILNNTKEWDVEVTVTDSFGGSTTYTGLFVGIGLPIFYIDRGMRAVSINSFPEAGQAFVVNGVDILGALKPKLIEPTALSVPGVTFGSFYVYQSAGVCMITLEFALSGAMSSWTPIATGLPAPATASLQSPVGWFDTATGWDTSYKRPTRVQITATGELRIRYGADGNYRISFSYPINA